MNDQNNNNNQLKIDTPHQPYGQHVDVINPLHGVNGVQKLRIGTEGQILTQDILISDKKGP